MTAPANCAADGMASHAAGYDHTSMPEAPGTAAPGAGRARGAACRAHAGWGVLTGRHLLLPLPDMGHRRRQARLTSVAVPAPSQGRTVGHRRGLNVIRYLSSESAFAEGCLRARAGWSCVLLAMTKCTGDT